MDSRPHQLKKATNQRWVFRAAFWLLCARTLRDKRVKKFAELDLDDVDAVFKTVDTHYNAGQPRQRRDEEAEGGAQSSYQRDSSVHQPIEPDDRSVWVYVRKRAR